MHVVVSDDRAFPDGTGKTIKTVETDLRVKSGDTIVIGGIFTEINTESRAGIPWLRNIPGLGYLFGAEVTTDDRTELLMFLTPTVVPAATANREP